MRFLIPAFLAAAFAVLAAGPAAADDLQPRDFSPSEDVPIRVVSMRDSAFGISLVFAVGNRTSKPIDASVGCSLYTAEGQAVGSLSSQIQAVPPQGEAVETTVGGEPGAAKAFCHVTNIRSK